MKTAIRSALDAAIATSQAAVVQQVLAHNGLSPQAAGMAGAIDALRTANPLVKSAISKETVARVESEREQFHTMLFAVAFDSAEQVCKAVETQRERMRMVLRQYYGDTCPTFAQFRADRADLKARAAQTGLVDDQWLRKPYNAAIIDLYGALPESDSPAAIAKRAQRDGAVKALPEASGAVKGNTTARDPSEAESIEQFIAKHGAGKVLEGLAKILATARASAIDAKTLQAVAAKYKI